MTGFFIVNQLWNSIKTNFWSLYFGKWHAELAEVLGNQASIAVLRQAQ